MKSAEFEKYEEYMRHCINLARMAKAKGESACGSVIVHDGKIISEGIEGGRAHRDISYHSEIEAIRHARIVLDAADLSDCILVTTHEPCIMCSYVIRHHQIKLVVIGVTTGEIGGYSSAHPILTDVSIKRWARSPEIIMGVMERECKEL